MQGAKREMRREDITRVLEKGDEGKRDERTRKKDRRRGRGMSGLERRKGRNRERAEQERKRERTKTGGWKVAKLEEGNRKSGRGRPTR